MGESFFLYPNEYTPSGIPSSPWSRDGGGEGRTQRPPLYHPFPRGNEKRGPRREDVTGRGRYFGCLCVVRGCGGSLSYEGWTRQQSGMRGVDGSRDGSCVDSNLWGGDLTTLPGVCPRGHGLPPCEPASPPPPWGGGCRVDPNPSEGRSGFGAPRVHGAPAGAAGRPRGPHQPGPPPHELRPAAGPEASQPLAPRPQLHTISPPPCPTSFPSFWKVYHGCPSMLL